MTERNRSARLRGASLVLRELAAGFRFFTARTSTSVPPGRAFGSSRTTLPFLILPRTVRTRPSVGASFYPGLPFSNNAGTAFSPPPPLQLRDGVLPLAELRQSAPCPRRCWIGS